MPDHARGLIRGLTDNGLSKKAAARLMGISRSSLYYRPKLPEKDAVLRERILETLETHPAYGYRRIAVHLGENGKRIHRVMRNHGIRPKKRRKGRKQPKRTHPGHAVFPNVAGTMSPVTHDAIWAGDFTKLETGPRQVVYFATVIDTFTREVLGWSLGLHHTTELVMEALENAVRMRGRAPPVFHSDQGSEYTSRRCIDWLLGKGIRPSHSPKGKPWKNGKQESFYSTFKLELGDTRSFGSITALYEAVAGTVAYYNMERIHSKLRMPPVAFYQRHKRVQDTPWHALPKPTYRWD